MSRYRLALVSAGWCVGLLEDEQFETLLRRVDSEAWGDFEESDLLDTVRDLARDLVGYKSGR